MIELAFSKSGVKRKQSTTLEKWSDILDLFSTSFLSHFRSTGLIKDKWNIISGPSI